MAAKKGLRLKPFSDKHIAYYKKCFKNRVNCLEGAYRAGKSLINVISFSSYLDSCEDKVHLVSGATASTARLNVADCNNLGLTSIFRGRCKPSKYEGNDCLRIQAKTGEKIVIFVGGGQADSYKRIQGLSFGSWISVELGNLYISDDEKDFIDMALSRLTQSTCERIWWDLNPTYPSHRIYTKYLDRYQKEQEEGVFVGGYNYEVCSLFDNLALTPAQKEKALSRYPDTESMEYKRFILGLRSYAAGLIFALFAGDQKRWLISDVRGWLKLVRPQYITIGVDFGGNGSNTAFVASLLYNNFRGVLVLADDLMIMKGGEQDSKDFRDRFKVFLLYVISLDIAPVRFIFGDNADTVMINEMRAVIRERKLVNQIRVEGCSKHTIKQRIDAKKMMMAEGRWLVCEGAKHVIDSTRTQVWDTREGHNDERLDNGSVDIDTADAEEYSWSAFLDKLISVK